MSRNCSQITLPNMGVKMNTLHKKIKGGSFLLDGGMGGQNTYNGIDDYIATTNQKQATRLNQGKGLSDQISSKLKNLNINPKKPKIKNISLSI